MFGSLLERYGLGFADPVLEREFKDEYVLRHIGIYQVVIFIAGFATYSFVLWDRAIDPENWRFGQFVRLYVMIPTLWLTGALLWIRPARQYMERAAEIWRELGLGPLALQPPWHGYELGDWSNSWTEFARNAVTREWTKNGENTFARRRGGITPETPVRLVEKSATKPPGLE